MLGSIAEKMKDSAAMFWQALDEREKMMIIYGGLYLVYSVVYAFTESEKKREHKRMKEEIVAELKANG